MSYVYGWYRLISFGNVSQNDHQWEESSINQLQMQDENNTCASEESSKTVRWPQTAWWMRPWESHQHHWKGISNFQFSKLPEKAVRVSTNLWFVIVINVLRYSQIMKDWTPVKFVAGHTMQDHYRAHCIKEVVLLPLKIIKDHFETNLRFMRCVFYVFHLSARITNFHQASLAKISGSL